MKAFVSIGILVGFFMSIAFFELSAQAFVVNGSASFQGGECYQLTPDQGGQAGSIFSQNTIDLRDPFYLEATLFFGCKDGNGADGIVFILATTNTALGNGGGGLGYEGITPSIAVEYDDYFNSNYSDPTADHMAIISMGSLDHALSSNLAGPITLPNIEDCMDHCFAVFWDPSTLTLTADLDGNSISYTGAIATTIFGGNPLVHYGFSSGTGSLSNIHRVCFGPPPLEEMEDVSVCEGESIELQADPNGIAWTWAPDPTLTPLNVSDPTATPDVTTTYTTIIEYNCNEFGYDTVEVTVIPSPVIDASNNGPLCEGEALHLMADGGVSYEWDGPLGFFSFSQNPVINNVTAGMAGTYTVTVTDAAGCTAVAETEVEVNVGPTISIDPVPDPICENYDPFQMTASPSGGIWSGDITEDGIFDPGYVGEGISIITYTAIDGNGCSNSEQIAVEVLMIPEVLIDEPGPICISADPVQLTASPGGGIWTGEISLSGLFDPQAAGEGPHLITYTANDGNGCTNSAEITVEVVSNLPVEISPDGPFCVNDTLVTLVGDPPGGIWGGAANSNGEINPNDLSDGLHLVTYDLTSQSECYYSEFFVEVVGVPVVEIVEEPPVCFNSPPIQLDGTPPGLAWSGAADANGMVDPMALGTGNHQVVYTDTTGPCPGNSATTVVMVLGMPTTQNVQMDCDSNGLYYTVTFEISAGDSTSYGVSGTTSGTVTPGSPATFISDPILNGSPFQFEIFDGNHCDSVMVSGSFDCNCATNAGIIDVTPLTFCEDGGIKLTTPIGIELQPDDTLVYILHTGNPDSIIRFLDTSMFVLFQPPMVFGVTYYISAIAGNLIPGMGIDLDDPCLSISASQPVTWFADPDGFVSGPAMTCANDSALITFNLIGGGPFDFVFTNNGFVFDTFINIDSGYTIFIYPPSSNNHLIWDLYDHSTGCARFITSGNFIPDVIDTFLTHQTMSMCHGDSIYLENDYQTSPGIYLDVFTSSVGCDSMVETTLTVYQLDTTYIDDTSCDSSLTGIFTQIIPDQNGCDSTTITTVTYAESDTTLLESNTCKETEAGIFTSLLTTQEGCDSLVIETIIYFPPDTTLLSENTCDEADAGTFIEVFFNAAGCDSLVIETVEYIPPDTTIITGETCDLSSSGTFSHLHTNEAGCDSLVIENISLLPSDTLVTHELTCSPQDTGTLIQVYTNSNGCDSLVWMITSLAPYDSCFGPPKEIFVPNVFSPNADGSNDFFFISSNAGSVSNLSYLRIFDRWGSLVFERLNLQPNDPQLGWDGTFIGQNLDPAVFVWSIHVEYTDGDEETLTGNITLMR